MAPPQTPQQVCGFHRPDGVVLPEADVRAAVVTAALAERTKWFDAAGKTLQKENDAARFGDLVRYWLSGHTKNVHPQKLRALEQAAIDPSITYGNLTAAALNSAIQTLAAAEAKVASRTADVYKASDVVDAAIPVATAARDALKLADAAVKSAKDDLVNARRLAAASGAGSAAQSAVNQALAASAAADTARAAAKKKFDDAQQALSVANKNLETARKNHARSVSARDDVKKPAKNWKDADRAKSRKAIVAKAKAILAKAGTPDAQDVDDLVNEELQLAHQSRADVEAWSAVFVVSRVRAAAIDTGLEVNDAKGHQGREVLLMATGRHSDYINEATSRSKKGTGGTYHSFLPGERDVQLGDIICTDRSDFIKAPTALKGLGRLPLHGDIVVKISTATGKECAETVGGNVRHSVRRRRYPMSGGRLVVSATRLVAQEDDSGNFAPFTTLPSKPTMLAPSSTGRIFALLSLVEKCRPAPAGKGAQGELLESPFLDSEILGPAAGAVTGADAEMPVVESPFEVFAAEPPSEEAVDFEEERSKLDPPDTVDDLAAQPMFPQAVRDRLGPLLDAKRTAEAVKWNSTWHPGRSGIEIATLCRRVERYLNRPAIEQAMKARTDLEALAASADAVLAMMAHQLQQKIFAGADHHDGKVKEGTLDALGFVRHRNDDLNAVDALNEKFHVKGRSRAFRRVQEIHASDRHAFESLGADVTAKTWYELFVNAPFLGQPFDRGVHVELMRRLRLAEQWLVAQPAYRGMSPVQLGAALRIDEAHHGGRTANNSSMHTLGLAVDVGYVKNPWVTGQHDNTGQLNTKRNGNFQAVTRNVSRLIAGTDEILTPAWLHSLGADSSRTTASAYDEVQLRHANLLNYLSLENDAGGLRAAIERASQRPHPELVVKPRETVDQAVLRWRATIRTDRARLQHALGSRRPANGFLNLHRDLVVALRDHGCLAWGAIDLGSRSSGDMMHFDCRATGIGWRLALDSQRTVGAGHPCATPAAAGTREAADEFETRPAGSDPSDFLGGKVWTFTSKTLPIRVAIFCPRVVDPRRKVEVLVYGHGLLEPCKPVPKAVPEDFITKPPFSLGKIVDASNRAIVLVVPFLDWGNFTRNNLNFEACDRRTMHVLGTPAKMNGLIVDVLMEIGRIFRVDPPRIDNLILAGHSRAYDLLNPLALAHFDPEMSRGPLAQLSEVWCLDTSYVCFVPEWMSWLEANSGLKVSVFYRKGTGTSACGQRFEAAMSKSGGRLRVMAVNEGHCAVPSTRLPALLHP